MRALLSFDGAYEHIEAIMKGSMAEYCRFHNIGLFKWAAGCSLVQQPNDVSKCHKILHAYFRKSSFRFFEDDRVRLRSGYSSAMRVLASHKATTKSKQTFRRFFAHLPQCLAVSFTPDAISKGYEVCGIYPFDVSKIMNGWNPGGKNPKSSWQVLSSAEQTYVEIAINKLSRIVEQEGTVDDDQIDECVVAEGLTVGSFQLLFPIFHSKLTRVSGGRCAFRCKMPPVHAHADNSRKGNQSQGLHSDDTSKLVAKGKGCACSDHE